MKGTQTRCACEHLTRDGAWDRPVLSGLEGLTNETVGACAAQLLDEPTLPERPALATALLGLRTSVPVRDRLRVAARGDTDPAVAAAALPSLRGTSDPEDVALLSVGLEKPDAAYATGAAVALAGNKAAAGALRKAASSHPDEGVRMAALRAFQETQSADWSTVVCTSMKEDPSADVRAAAIRLTVGTDNPAVLQCLRDRAFQLETDSVPRRALLDTLSHTNVPAAADVLCDVMGFWVRSYVTDKKAERESDQDIVWFQNQRDYPRTPECLQAAWKEGGYTCWGKAYLGGKLEDVGRGGHVPDCDGTGRGGGGNGPREISF